MEYSGNFMRFWVFLMTYRFMPDGGKMNDAGEIFYILPASSVFVVALWVFQ